MNRVLCRPLQRKQRGLATLVVVMVLFFIISLVAAYTNRNLIFEQRTSANQYRSTQALEAADAGIEWALALLNYGRITAACTQSAASTDTSFRQRYLDIDGVTGNMTARRTAANTDLLPTCVLDGGQWRCSCPDVGDPVLIPTAGDGVHPAFRVRFQQISPAAPALPGQPGVVKIQAVGCTRLADDCLEFNGQGMTNEGRAVVTALVALTGNLASPPAAAVLARGNVAMGGAALEAHNSDPAGIGITIQAGGTITGTNLVLTGPAGTPGSRTLAGLDPALDPLSPEMAPDPAAVPPFSTDDRMFAAPFNMRPSTFKQQPAALVLGCAGGTCSAVDVRDAVLMNPGRPIWVEGNLAVDTAGDIGSATPPALPVLIVVEGDLTFSVAGAEINGLVYVRTANWSTAGLFGRVNGGVIAQGDIGGNGTPVIVHDADLLRRLRATTGSFVRVPGSWKDFN